MSFIKPKGLWALILSLLAVSLPSLAMADELSSGDTAWILTSTALVLFMTIPGLSLFYAGLVRSKNVLSVLMQCFAITCMVSILWFAYGYNLAFGDGGSMNQWMGGFSNLFMSNVDRASMSGTIPETVFAMFQMTFAIITPALIVGGMGVVAKPLRLPSTRAATSAATPALICTTVPPAKSSRPISMSQPPPQTQ